MRRQRIVRTFEDERRSFLRIFNRDAVNIVDCDTVYKLR